MRYSVRFAHWWADKPRWQPKRHARYDHPAVTRWVSFRAAKALVAELAGTAKLGFTPFVRQNAKLRPGRGQTIDHRQKPIIEFGWGNVPVSLVCHELAHAAVFRKVPGAETHGREWRAWRDRLLDLAIERAVEV